MIQRYNPSEFREPTPTEMADAQDAITESYIAGDDRYDLQRYLQEQVVDALWKQARHNRIVPFIAWETVVYRAAVEIAAKWDVEEWAKFRARGNK